MSHAEVCPACGGSGWVIVPDEPDGREDPAASTKINYVPGEENK